jgi:hypothetical protein
MAVCADNGGMTPMGDDARPRRRLTAVCVLLAAVTGMLTLAPLPLTEVPAAAATGYSPPSWLPLRGDSLIGCVTTNCNGGGHGEVAIDIPFDRWTPIYATGSGKVIAVEDDRGGNCDPATYNTLSDCPPSKSGNGVLVDHGGDVYSFYGHFEDVRVKVGQMVTEGTVLGAAGDSGWTPPGFVHLHYEEWDGLLWEGGRRVMPRDMKACHNGKTVTYPDVAGSTSWNGLTGFRVTLRHDGGCNTNGPTCITGFYDVLGSAVFCNEIEWLVESLITTGFPDGRFHPHWTTTRQAGVAWLYRWAGSPPGPFPDPGFRDVPRSHDFYDEIAWAVSKGIVEGYQDGRFGDTQDVSRQAFVAWLYRLAEAPPGPYPPTGLADVTQFVDEIGWAVEAGIVTGYDDGTFQGRRDVSRQEGAALLYRFDQ